MDIKLAQIVGDALIEVGKKVKQGTCELTDDEAITILSSVTHVPMSREQACNYLNIHNTKFNELIIRNKIPKGRKRRGFKELYWYQDELDNAITMMNNEAN